MQNDFIKFEGNIIAGPCSAESKRQVLTTVKELVDENVNTIREGLNAYKQEKELEFKTLQQKQNHSNKGVEK